MSLANPIDKIFDNFYIGNSSGSRDASLLRDNHIGVVVNVAKDLNDPWFPDIMSFKFGIVDGKSHENCPYLYMTAAEIIIYYLSRNVPVLLHCHEGISRSGAVGALVVAWMQKMKLSDAICYLQEKRPQIFIHYGHLSNIDVAWGALRTKLDHMEKLNATG